MSDANQARFPNVHERTEAEQPWIKGKHSFEVVEDETGSWRVYDLDREVRDVEDDIAQLNRRLHPQIAPEPLWRYWSDQPVWPVMLGVVWIHTGGDTMATMVAWEEFQRLKSLRTLDLCTAAQAMMDALHRGDVIGKGIRPPFDPRDERYETIGQAEWRDLCFGVGDPHANAHAPGNDTVVYLLLGVTRDTLLDLVRPKPRKLGGKPGASPHKTDEAERRIREWLRSHNYEVHKLQERSGKFLERELGKDILEGTYRLAKKRILPGT